ncbi:MAG TPA: glycosyltransferase family 4 protein [Opitutaceae bacterium]|nr:glycosyltransferase family 4 protein [Opitutaceae bacterium]
MKILMICEFFNEKLEYQENLLVKYYRKFGHEVTVIASTFDSVFDYYTDRHDSSWPSRTYSYAGAKIHKLRYSFNVLNRFRRYTSISAIIAESTPDLIYIHDIMLNIPEVVAYKKRNPHCAVILDYHADYSNSGKNWISLKILHGVLRKHYLDMVLPHLSKIFIAWPACGDFLKEVYGVEESKLELLPLGADTDLGQAVRESGARERVRQTLGINSEDLLIFSGGKFTPAKRTELLMQAFIETNNPRLHLVLVGSATDDDRLYMEKLKMLGRKSARIHLVGWATTTGIYEYLAASDFAVFPASQSVLWQHAMSMGLPLVVGDIGGQDFSYLNKYSSVKILRGAAISVPGVRRELEDLALNDNLRNRMAAGARAATAEFLDWNHLVGRTLRFCRV